jgi:type IV pilus assembly protein PilC
MAVFTWQGKTRLGEVRSGELEGRNATEVKEKLRQQGVVVDKVKRKPIEIVIRMPGSTGIETRDLVIFTRQFSTMIDAGLPLNQCLDILGGQSENPDLKKVLLDVKERIEGGMTFADSLAAHPKVFNRLFVNLVSAGEKGGVLDTVMVRISQYLEKNMKLVQAVKAALMYPAMILGVSGLVTVVLLVFVIPVFEGMFKDFGKDLPAPTQMVIDVSQFTQDNILILMAGFALLAFGAKMAADHPKGRYLIDSYSLKLPAVGMMLRKLVVARFTRTLATMLGSGVNILEALEVVAASSGNVFVEEKIIAVRQRISEGSTMAVAMSNHSIFPGMVVQMVSVGESTGAMDVMLSKIADFYDDEVDVAIGTMMTMLEPMIMAFLAVILGGLVISMYLPVFEMAGSM